jgi:hypothetical protein
VRARLHGPDLCSGFERDPHAAHWLSTRYALPVRVEHEANGAVVFVEETDFTQYWLCGPCAIQAYNAQQREAVQR